MSQVKLSDGAELPADLVLLAVGARPNDDLAAAAGLACEDGVVVDEHGQTADPAIWAAGDCTRFPSRRYGRKLRLECVQNAIDQAKAVASALLGKPQTYDPVPWFWSDQYELKLQMAGLSEGYDDAKTVGDVAAARVLGRVPQERQADRGRCRERRPRLHERPQADCGRNGLS